LHAAKESGCNKIIFSSSAAVYSKHNSQPVTEGSDLGAESVYGETKLACENIIKDFCEENVMDAVIFRYFNVSGCHKNKLFFENNKNSENLMINIIDVAKGNLKELAIFGGNYNTKDGTATRDYIHIEDLLGAHIKILDLFKEVKGCEIFNLGSGEETSVLQLLKIFEQSNGLKIRYKISNPRLGDLPTSFSNPRKFNIFSDWTTHKNLQDICKDSWDSNKDQT
jgi:UDP-glucose 4-epimerase